LEGRFWKKLCTALGLAQYADLQYDEPRRLEIIAAFQSCFLQKSARAWEEALGDLDLCVSAVHTIDEAFDLPLFRERDMIVAMRRDDGTSETNIGVPIKLSATPGSVRTPRAQFGQNTQKILQEFGYSPEQIKHLQDKNII